MGLYYTPFRWYASGAGRWLTRDPFGMVDGPNLYSYTGANPVNRRDCSGGMGGSPIWLPEPWPSIVLLVCAWLEQLYIQSGNSKGGHDPGACFLMCVESKGSWPTDWCPLDPPDEPPRPEDPDPEDPFLIPVPVPIPIRVPQPPLEPAWQRQPRGLGPSTLHTNPGLACEILNGKF